MAENTVFEIDSLLLSLEGDNSEFGSSDMDNIDGLIKDLETSPSAPRMTMSSGGSSMPGLRPVSGVGRGAMVDPALNGNGNSNNIVSFGPGRGFVRPVARGRGGAGVEGMATHTPDGRRIIVKGPDCAGCGKMIVGKITKAMNKDWHPDHFVCTTCSQPFPQGRFFENDGKPYCEKHYSEFFAPKCARCHQPITERLINAINKTWHADHFTCQGCGTLLTGKVYKEAAGEPFCPQCKKDTDIEIDPKLHICADCKRPIIGEYILIRGQYFHPEHYECFACGKDLSNGDCKEFQGRRYCQEDWLKLQKDTCAGCRRPITGRSITACGRVWHPEHFCCSHCQEPFAGRKHYEREGLPYCEPHYKQLFGDVCAKCGNLVLAGVKLLGKNYHADCFECQGCYSILELKEGNIISWEDKPMCKKCYLKLPKKVRKKVEKKARGEKEAEKKKKLKEYREQKQYEKEMKSKSKAARKEAKADHKNNGGWDL